MKRSIALIAANVKRLRNEKGISQGELAARCRLPKASLSKIENARMGINIRTLAKLALGLEVAPYILLMSRDEADLITLRIGEKAQKGSLPVLALLPAQWTAA